MFQKKDWGTVINYTVTIGIVVTIVIINCSTKEILVLTLTFFTVGVTVLKFIFPQRSQTQMNSA